MGMWHDEGALRVLYGIQQGLQTSPGFLDPYSTNFSIVLFKNDFSESRGNTFAGMVSSVADFVGYAAVPTLYVFGYAPAEIAGQPRLIGDPVTFTKLSGYPSQYCYGWGIMGYNSATPTCLLLARKFLDPHNFTDASPSLSFYPILGAYGLP